MSDSMTMDEIMKAMADMDIEVVDAVHEGDDMYYERKAEGVFGDDTHTTGDFTQMVDALKVMDRLSLGDDMDELTEADLIY